MTESSAPAPDYQPQIDSAFREHLSQRYVDTMLRSHVVEPPGANTLKMLFAKNLMKINDPGWHWNEKVPHIMNAGIPSWDFDNVPIFQACRQAYNHRITERMHVSTPSLQQKPRYSCCEHCQHMSGSAPVHFMLCPQCKPDGEGNQLL